MQPDRPLIYRHKPATRIWHWANALAILVLLMSGAMIFNAHPRLYWGQYGANPDRAWLQIGATADRGFVQLGDTRIDTTGVLGRWTGADGTPQARAFPHWATIPSTYNLALARRWHLAVSLVFAFGLLAFMAASLVNGHFRRDLRIRRRDVSPRVIAHDVVEHLKLRFHDPDDPAAFNVLQKLSYVGVIFLLLPLLVVTGLGMSPGMDAAWPWLVDLLGGRQSARSLHFVCAALILGFILVHLVLVLLSGPRNGIRSMITGRVRAGPRT